MQTGSEEWFVLEASGWRARALKAEAELAALRLPSQDSPTAGEASGGDAGQDGRGVSAEVSQRLERIAASGLEPGSNRNMMLKPADARTILAALARSDSAGVEAGDDMTAVYLAGRYNGCKDATTASGGGEREATRIADELDRLSSTHRPLLTAASRMLRTFAQPATREDEADQLRSELKQAREALVPDMFWDADDPERPYDDPLEWLENVWPVGIEPIINRFQQAMRGPDVWELFIPGKDDDDDWTSRSFSTREEAEAARAALSDSAKAGA